MPTLNEDLRDCSICECSDRKVCEQSGPRCGWPLCFERATVLISRGSSRVKRLRCERHLRGDLVTAERFSQAIVVQALSRPQPELLL